jgi:hypothetical protein
MVTAVVLFCPLVCRGGRRGPGVVPPKRYDGPTRGLHNTIGITTPTERQLRWVLIVWVLSTVVIFDAMALLLTYVF